MQYLGLDSYPSSLVRVRSPQYAILGQTVQLYCNFTLPPGNNNFYSLKVGLEKYFISIVLVVWIKQVSPIISDLPNSAHSTYFSILNLNFSVAKLSQAKPQLQLSWLALASLNFT